MSWKKILIVDDEREFGITLAERLLFRNYDAKFIDNIEDSIIEIKNTQPDLVLLDLRMPGGFGMSTVKAIKDISPNTKVLIVTGHGSSDWIDEAMNYGAEGYIMKPLEMDNLLARIRELLIEGDL